MLCTLHNHAVVVVVDKLEVKCSSSRTSNWRSHPSCMVPSRWPTPSEGSAVLTELRLGRVARDARVPYLRFWAICIVNVRMTHTTSRACSLNSSGALSSVL